MKLCGSHNHYTTAPLFMLVNSPPFDINVLENAGFLFVEWFENNFMKLDQNKCHLVISGYKHEGICAKAEEEIIWERKNRKLLSDVTFPNPKRFR